MRLFVAVNYPARLRQKIARLCRPLEDAGIPGRWTEPDEVHLTLKFFGEVANSEVDAISSVLVEVAGRFRPFDMRFGPIGAFPSPRRPRVVWLGVEFRRLEEIARSLKITDEYRVTHLDLMQSKLGPAGAVHTRLVAARLGKRG